MTETFPLTVWDAVTIDADRSDDDLAARFRAGEDNAFERVVSDYGQRIVRLVYRLTGWAGDTEDLVQDVFLRAFQNRTKFRGDARLSTWLTSIAINSCRSHHRRQTIRDRILLGLWRRGTENGTLEEPPESHESVRVAVRRLPAKSREVIVLRYFEELPIAEIAEILHTSHNAVETRLSRARRRLKVVLAEFEQRESL